MKTSCLHNEEQVALNYCTRLLGNKPSLDAGQNLQHVLACFDVALSALPKVLHVVLVIDEVGGIRINVSSAKNVAAILDDFLHSTQISAKGFDHKLRAVASHSIVKHLR